MRKVFTSLLVLGLFLMLPMSAFATTKIEIPDSTPEKETANSDGTVTKEYPIYMVTTAGEEVTSATISFQGGSAVKNITCDGAGQFTLEDQSGSTTNSTKCTFTVPSGGKASGEKITVGRLAVKVDKTASDEDCKIEYTFNDVKGYVKTNPETGASVPYIVIGSAIILAAGVYFVTSRRTKLYKI